MYFKRITILLYYGVFLFSVLGQPVTDEHENNKQESELETIGTTIDHDDADEVTESQQSDTGTSSIATDITETMTHPQLYNIETTSLTENEEDVAEIDERLKGIDMGDEPPITLNIVDSLMDCENNDTPKPAIKKVLYPKPNIFSESEMDERRKEFQLHDINRDGFISVSELYEILNKTGWNMSLENVQDIIEINDIDGNGSIDFFEYLVMMQTNSDRKQNMKMFILLDKDKNTFLSRDEIVNFLKENYTPISEKTIDCILNSFDKNEDGTISFEEYMNYKKQN
ncbi:calmodulin-like [Adelges cooleyi]|uniref:calmodulin-like n=1 Tax=Adelges cooleyi TaxID=133065 RepID=UPI00217F8FE2|nr:calmodulin-like [Adelges cooleyi]